MEALLHRVGWEEEVSLLSSPLLVYFQMKAKNALGSPAPSWMKAYFLKSLVPTLTPPHLSKGELTKKNNRFYALSNWRHGPSRFCPWLMLRNLTALQVLLRDSIDVRSLSSLLPTLQTHKLWLRPPSTGQLSSSYQWDFPCRCPLQDLRHPLVSALLTPRLSCPVSSTTERPGEVEERRLFSPIGQTPQWSDFHQLQTCTDGSWPPANTSIVNLIIAFIGLPLKTHSLH